MSPFYCTLALIANSQEKRKTLLRPIMSSPLSTQDHQVDKVIDRPPPEVDRLQPLIGYMRDEKLSKAQVLRALERRGDEISPAHRAVFSLLFGIPIPG